MQSEGYELLCRLLYLKETHSNAYLDTVSNELDVCLIVARTMYTKTCNVNEGKITWCNMEHEQMYKNEL